MSAVGAAPARGYRPGAAVALVATGLAVVPVAVAVPLRVVLVVPVVAGLVALGYARPAWAAYLLLALTPLTAGMTRGVYLPVLRPHEALGLLLGAGVALRALVHLYQGYRWYPRVTIVDAAILAMAVTSSVLPLIWMAARGLAATTEDLLYAATIWKFYALFVLVRACVRTEDQVRRCLQVSIAANAVVAVIAIVQSVYGGRLAEVILRIYATEEPRGAAEGRGTATLASSIAVGDVLAISLAICLVLLLRERRHRLLLSGLVVLFAVGGLASGQFSGLFAVVVAVFAVAVVTRYVRRLLVATVPMALVGAVVLRPVVEKRIVDFDISTGLPHSWSVRLDNLRLYVWPEVFHGQNWLFGVRPSSHIRIDASWGPYIYIESGHTWLLWTGGVPLAVAFLAFTWVALRTSGAMARARRGPLGAAATGAFAGVLIVFMLMSFDPHLTMRGVADLVFALLAMVTAAGTRLSTGDRHAVEPHTPPRIPALGGPGAIGHADR